MKKSEMRDLNKGLDDKNYDTKVSVTKTNYDGDGIKPSNKLPPS
jgi:hypothetical protein